MRATREAMVDLLANRLAQADGWCDIGELQRRNGRLAADTRQQAAIAIDLVIEVFPDIQIHPEAAASI